MRWPWNKHETELEQAQNEQKEAKRRDERIEPKLQRLERAKDINQFASRIREALGG